MRWLNGDAPADAQLGTGREGRCYERRSVALTFAIVSLIDVALFVLVFLLVRSRRVGSRKRAAVIIVAAFAYLTSLVVFLWLSLH